MHSACLGWHLETYVLETTQHIKNKDISVEELKEQIKKNYRTSQMYILSMEKPESKQETFINQLLIHTIMQRKCMKNH